MTVLLRLGSFFVVLSTVINNIYGFEIFQVYQRNVKRKIAYQMTNVLFYASLSIKLFR